jgi:hypothetical protein
LHIRYISRNQIDTARWDELISRSEAENLYPYSWYLDAAAGRWSALVYKDYQAVMPLVWKRKFGIRYLYQPFYTPQLWVFSESHADPHMITSLLRQVARKFRVGTIQFNHRNLVGEVQPFTVVDRVNYVLSLEGGYDSLARGYSENTRRNLRKALEFNPEISREISIDELVSLKRENDVIKRSESDSRWLKSLLETIRNKSTGVIYASVQNWVPDAAAFFGISRTRAVYLLSASNEKGIENRSMFKLVDAFIRDHAGSALVLDFEGSNLPGVARFFSGFGAVPETYQRVQFNRLPLPVKGVRRGRDPEEPHRANG